MSTWKEFKRTKINGVEIVVHERMDLRNRHGAMDYRIDAFVDGQLRHSERHSQSTWLGHCYGQLLLPIIAKRAIQNNKPS